MSDKNPPARHKVVWGYGIIHKYLNWYIRTSEVIPKEQQLEMTESVERLLKQLQTAERKERKVRPRSQMQDSEWKDSLNEVKKSLGQRPVGERRLVDELIQAILGNR